MMQQLHKTVWQINSVKQLVYIALNVPAHKILKSDQIFDLLLTVQRLIT